MGGARGVAAAARVRGCVAIELRTWGREPASIAAMRAAGRGRGACAGAAEAGRCRFDVAAVTPPAGGHGGWQGARPERETRTCDADMLRAPRGPAPMRPSTRRRQRTHAHHARQRLGSPPSPMQLTVCANRSAALVLTIVVTSPVAMGRLWACALYARPRARSGASTAIAPLAADIALGVPQRPEARGGPQGCVRASMRCVCSNSAGCPGQPTKRNGGEATGRVTAGGRSEEQGLACCVLGCVLPWWG